MKRAGALTILALGLLALPVAEARPQKVIACNLQAVVIMFPGCTSPPQFDGTVDPAQISATKRQPVRVTLGASQDLPFYVLRSETELEIDFDRSGSYSPAGRGSCSRSDIAHVGSAEARARCRSEIVGFGSAKIETEPDEDTPFPVRLTLFRGGRTSAGDHVLIHGFILPPISEPIVAVATLTPIDEEEFGLRASVRMPSIMGGTGALKSFRIRLLRRFGYAVTRCPRVRPSLAARMSLVVEDGPETPGVRTVRPCTPTAQRARGR